MLEEFLSEIFLARGQNSRHLILGYFLFLARAAYSARARAQNLKIFFSELELQIGTVKFFQNTLVFKITIGGGRQKYLIQKIFKHMRSP